MCSKSVVPSASGRHPKVARTSSARQNASCSFRRSLTAVGVTSATLPVKATMTNDAVPSNAHATTKPASGDRVMSSPTLITVQPQVRLLATTAFGNPSSRDVRPMRPSKRASSTVSCSCKAGTNRDLIVGRVPYVLGDALHHQVLSFNHECVQHHPVPPELGRDVEKPMVLGLQEYSAVRFLVQPQVATRGLLQLCSRLRSGHKSSLCRQYQVLASSS